MAEKPQGGGMHDLNAQMLGDRCLWQEGVTMDWSCVLTGVPRIAS